MIRFKFIKKIILFVSVAAVTLFIFSCNKSNNESNLAISTATVATSNDYKYYNIFNISPYEIIIPKNQTISQSLSVVVSNGNGELIVFDGGRVKDADYLMDIIKERGGKVKYWFLTHIHDDHIGALISILNKKSLDIEIENIYYDFANFNWYYEKMGDDAGIYYLFESAIKDYNDFLINNNKIPTTILNYREEHALYFLAGDLYVYVLNNHFELDSDPINNTSVAYTVGIKGVHVLILGDLGYEGGNILFKDNFINNDIDNKVAYHNLENSFSTNHPIDILVLSHHGQNGIDPIYYKRIKPKVVVWPTSEDIYANTHGRYYTDDTKKVLSEMDSIEYQIKSYEETAVIR